MISSASDSSHFDIIVVGSGFAGSLAAICLAQSGFRVCMVEKESHPRFAIGESSTPIADMILRSLSEEYNLPWLYPLSRYGSWRKNYPELTCGLKRGFSYFLHRKGEPFQSSKDHSHELLVAASSSDEQSDTNWFRSDLDAFLVTKAISYGVIFHEKTLIQSCRRTDALYWQLELHPDDNREPVTGRFLIDATGSSRFSEQFLGTTSRNDTFQTDSEAYFTHLTGAELWTSILQNRPDRFLDDYPFHPDHSALHHLIDEGWVWMLRFYNGLLSLGVVLDRHRERGIYRAFHDVQEQILNQYPSLKQILQSAEPAPAPGRWIASGRLQRRLSHTFGEGWVALNHTAGFTDPLHSTGIAHSLSGLEKLIPLLKRTLKQNRLRELEIGLQKQQAIFYQELELIDLLVAGCYRAGTNFSLFTAWTMLYFTCTIHYEQQRLQGEMPGAFLSADKAPLLEIVQKSYRELESLCLQGDPGEKETARFTRLIRNRIEPWNRAGLLDPARKNMYRHTAAILPWH